MLLRLSFLHMWREKHYPEFKVMAVALFLAVFAISTLLVLTQAIRQSVFGEASILLGADLIVESSDPLPDEYLQYAKNQNLKATMVIEFFSMMNANNQSSLAAISAIEGEFPLKGNMSIYQNKKLETRKIPPSSSQVWIEETLALKLKVNQGDSVTIGDATFIIDGFLAQRPVALSDSSALAPVAYVNAKDLPKMAVLQPGSRATYRLLLAGDIELLTKFKNHFKTSDAITWVSAAQGRPAINRIISYSQRYLVVILLIQVLLAGIAIALCAHQYSLRQQKNIALWKSFGATSNTIIRLQFTSLLILALLVLALAISSGYILGIELLKQSQFAYVIGQINWQGGGLAGVSGLILMIGFGLGPVWELKHTSALQLLQRQTMPVSRLGWITAISAMVLLALIFNAYLQESDVALRLGLQIAFLSMLAFAVAYLLWSGFDRLKSHGGLIWRFGIAYMVRHKTNSITQWFVFMLVIMLLLLLHIIQKDFLATWKAELPRSAPNYFLINIQSQQIEPLQKWFTENDINEVHFYPVVRGRMSHINGKRIEEINESGQQKKGLQRSLNLTWMKDLPVDNHVTSGEDWHNVLDGQGLISIEQKFAQRQGLSLGDTIGFQIAEKEITGKIVQMRSVQWESFKPNFFVIFPPKVLDALPHSYITSIYLPESKKPDLMSLAKDYVEISIIDIDTLLQQARKVIDKISQGIHALLLLVFILGLLIMYASILSCLKERMTESAMLQILGANKRFIAKVLMIEFGLLGFLSGLMGSLIALILAQDLVKRFFEFPLPINYTVLAIGIIGGTVIVLIFGLIGTRKVFKVSPLWLLRQS